MGRIYAKSATIKTVWGSVILKRKTGAKHLMGVAKDFVTIIEHKSVLSHTVTLCRKRMKDISSTRKLHANMKFHRIYAVNA